MPDVGEFLVRDRISPTYKRQSGGKVFDLGLGELMILSAKQRGALRTFNNLTTTTPTRTNPLFAGLG